jgi:hypothetical protein
MKVQWMPLNWITLGQTITDPFNRMIPVTEHMSYKRMLLRDIRVYSGLDQSGSFWSNYPNDPFNRDPIKRRPLYYKFYYSLLTTSKNIHLTVALHF